MSAPVSPPIKRFVQETLGCACPEEVFERIDHRRHRVGDVAGVQRIDVGRRLLVYLVETDDPAWLQRHLAELVRAGVADRDAQGMNRFRLVIASTRPDLVAAGAHALFHELAGGDAKVHLHLVAQDALDDL